MLYPTTDSPDTVAPLAFDKPTIKPKANTTSASQRFTRQ
jgi:hypothetical protein